MNQNLRFNEIFWFFLPDKKRESFVPEDFDPPLWIFPVKSSEPCHHLAFRTETGFQHICPKKDNDWINLIVDLIWNQYCLKKKY